jgi:Transmembrane secretion effector
LAEFGQNISAERSWMSRLLPSASSTWAPLRTGLFRTLWIAALISNVGEWMQTVGVQWLLVHGPHAAVLVSLVQTADALPAVLFALVAGVLATFSTGSSCSSRFWPA